MKISLLTYNVLFNIALDKIAALLKEYKPDILCLQEAHTTENYLQQLETNGYQLADFSHSFMHFGKIYGLATFYNTQTLQLVQSGSLDLPRSFYEAFNMLLRGFTNPRTVLNTEFIHTESGEKIDICNIHLTHLLGSNTTRVKQIQEALKDPHLDESKNLIIAGDFNYPYGRKKLEELITSYNLLEATHNLPYTYEINIWNLFRIHLKLDYIFYKGCKLIDTKRIECKYSDHYPIFSEFEIEKKSNQVIE
jgi:endonuclease/exonuclease/phosphatase family metal-dependent hydrolase